MKPAQSQKEYVVKYLGIVEGNVGCLSRKLHMPSAQTLPKPPVGIQTRTEMKRY